MRLAEYIDTHGGREGGEVREGGGGGGLREWFIKGKTEVLDLLAQEVSRCEQGRRESVQSSTER